MTVSFAILIDGGFADRTLIGVRHRLQADAIARLPEPAFGLCATPPISRRIGLQAMACIHLHAGRGAPQLHQAAADGLAQQRSRAQAGWRGGAGKPGRAGGAAAEGADGAVSSSTRQWSSPPAMRHRSKGWATASPTRR